MKKTLVLIIGLLGMSHAFSLNIDDRIAQELGLVPQNQNSGSSRITVDLLLDKPRELVFPAQGKLKMKRVDKQKFEILNINNSLHIQPKVEVTEPVIGIFTLNDNQKSYLIEFKTVKAYTNYNAVIVDTPTQRAVVTSSQKTIKRVPVPGRTGRTKTSAYDDYVTLARFAVQTMYAPDRIIKPPKGTRQVTVSKKMKLDTLTRENGLSFSPLSSFEYKGLYATALLVENRQDNSISLSPDLIRGQFIGKVFRHKTVGTDDDDRFSALVLLSQIPFEQALQTQVQ